MAVGMIFKIPDSKRLVDGLQAIALLKEASHQFMIVRKNVAVFIQV
jgi:hypothetical protein